MPGSKGQESRKKLLDAAHAEFCALGPSGARVDEIARRSGLNKQRIYAYFGSKEELFAEVLGRAFERLTQHVPIPVDAAALRRYAGEVFDFHQGDDALIRLLAWEGLHYGELGAKTGYDRRAYYTARTTPLAASLGLPDADSAARVVLSIVAIASWPFIVPQQRRLLLGADEDSAALLRDSVMAAGEAIVDSVMRQASVH